MIITFGCFKGGVGKTTTTALFAYILANMKHKKVLCIDTDPQSNLSSLLRKTYNYESFNGYDTLYDVLFNGVDINQAIINLSNQLDLLSGSWDMVNFTEMVNRNVKQSYRSLLLAELLSQVHGYDYILIDTAPSTDLMMDNVISATDYVLITTQTVPLAFDSTQKFYNYLLKQYQSEHTNFELLGVLPYLVGKSATDRKLLAEYQEVFTEELLTNYIRQSDRVKTWSVDGITSTQPHDQRTLRMYETVVDEALERMEALNEA